MPETVRLKLVEQQPKGFFFRKKTPAPDYVLHGQMKMRAADTCLEHIRSMFARLQDQEDVHELMGKIIEDARRQARAHQESEE